MIRKTKFWILLFVILSIPLLADIEYTIVLLEPASYKPPHSKKISQIYDLNENGYVVGTYPLGDFTKSFIYHTKKGFQDIFCPIADLKLIATKVNNKGIVSGLLENRTGFLNEKDEGIFIFDQKNNLFTPILNQKNYRTIGVLGISDSGKILVKGWSSLDKTYNGYIYDISTQEINYDIPTGLVAMNSLGNVIGDHQYYSPETGIITFGSFLNNYLGWDVTARVINDNNVVAGIAIADPNYHLQYRSKGFIWDKEKGTRTIPTLGGHTIKINAINNRSQVVGSSDTEDLLFNSAFIFDESLGIIDLGTLDGEKSCANDINDLTQVVGHAESYSFSKGSINKAFIWDPMNGMRDLNNLIPSNSGWKRLEKAIKINNEGYIIGKGIYQGEERFFLLIPKH